MTKELPSPEVLRKLLRYEPETGKLFWRKRAIDTKGWNNRYAYKEAGNFSPRGYVTMYVLGISTSAHRVIWAMCKGFWPTEEIDHIDGNRSNNCISNLREANRSQNKCNQGLSTVNKSGRKGVYRAGERWRSQITLNGKKKHLGYFETADEAHAAYIEAALKLHGEYAKVY